MRIELANTDEIKIVVEEHTVVVTTPYRKHTAGWDDNEEVFEIPGVGAFDHNLVKAAMNAWEGEDEFTLTYEELRARGGGWI